MILFEKLKNNKGTISSALGKEIASEVLIGDLGLLSEALELCKYNKDIKKDKNIRAGAAKIIEIVAEKKPELVSENLDQLLPCLEVHEAQTRWMIIRTFGFCAKHNTKIAIKGFTFAKEYLNNKEGLCLSSSADLYLGDLGAVSKELTDMVWPILRKSEITCIKNEADWILESYMKLANYLSEKQKDEIIPFIKTWENTDRKTTQKRVKKLIKLMNR